MAPKKCTAKSTQSCYSEGESSSGGGGGARGGSIVVRDPSWRRGRIGEPQNASLVETHLPTSSRTTTLPQGLAALGVI